MVTLSNVARVTSSTSVVGSFLASSHQLYLGYIYEGADGFSPVLLMCWLLGDVLNVIGTVWTHQLVFQRVIALASLSTDLLLASQHLYYKRKHRFHSSPQRSSGWRSQWNAMLRPYILFTLVSAARAHSVLDDPSNDYVDWEYLVGQCMAWVAELSYAFALVPQVMDNFARKCTGSVSLVMFLADAFASANYLATILITAGEEPTRHETLDFVMDELPYICGTSACFVLDIVILAQYFVYPEFIATEFIGEFDESFYGVEAEPLAPAHTATSTKTIRGPRPTEPQTGPGPYGATYE